MKLVPFLVIINGKCYFFKSSTSNPDLIKWKGNKYSVIKKNESLYWETYWEYMYNMLKSPDMSRILLKLVHVNCDKKSIEEARSFFEKEQLRIEIKGIDEWLPEYCSDTSFKKRTFIIEESAWEIDCEKNSITERVPEKAGILQGSTLEAVDIVRGLSDSGKKQGKAEVSFLPPEAEKETSRVQWEEENPEEQKHRRLRQSERLNIFVQSSNVDPKGNKK